MHANTLSDAEVVSNPVATRGSCPECEVPSQPRNHDER